MFDEIVEYLPVHKYNGYAVARCLFHEDNNPSMFIYPDGFYCKSCGARGPLERILEKLGKTKRKPVQKNISGPEWSLDTIETYCMDAHRYLTVHPEYDFYLRGRKVEGFIEKLFLGYRDGFYIIPIIDKTGNIVGAVARTGPARASYTPFPYFTPYGQKGMMWSPDWSQVHGKVYLPFGIFDVLTLCQLGLPVIGFTNGKAINPSLLQPFLDTITQVVIIPDRDERSNKESHNAWKLCQELSWRGRVKMLDYPIDCKDSNDVFVKYGADALKDMIGE